MRYIHIIYEGVVCNKIIMETEYIKGLILFNLKN